MSNKPVHIAKSILIATIILLLLSSMASAALSGYAHQRNLTINNTGDSSLSHQPYNFTLNTASLVAAGKMFANGTDLEIATDADVILSWWNETDFNDTSTKIWVNGTSLSNTTNTTHHIYYKKSADVVFDGDISATFDYGEDFEYGSAGYDLIANTDWANALTPNAFVTDTTSKHGKYSGKQSSTGGDGRMELDISNYPLTSEKFCYEFDWYVSDNTSDYTVSFHKSATNSLYMRYGNPNADDLSYYDGTMHQLTTMPKQTWHKMKLVINPTNNKFDAFMNGTQILDDGSLRSGSFSGDLYFEIQSIYGLLDNIFLREYHDNNITVYLGGETDIGSISISSPSPATSATKYVSNKTITYSATTSKTADNKWSYENGTFIEWDNSTTSPSMEVWINTSAIKYFNISLVAYETADKSNNNEETWNNPITDDIFDSTNYTWSRWDELDLEGWIGYAGNIEVGDVDNDGADEMIVVGQISGNAVNNRDMIFYDLDGTKTRYADVSSPNYIFADASVHDVTEDGINEMLCIFSKDVDAPHDGISDLYRFNTGGLTNSSLNNDIMTSSSNNPKSISWIDVDYNEHYYSCGCGSGETVNCYTTFSSHSATEIDDFVISAEDNLAWDIDGDGVMELLVVEGWAAGAAKIWMYEIHQATGAPTSKTMLFDNNSIGGTHFSCALAAGDIDNDGIDNLLLLWSGATACYTAAPYRVEAYEFSGITHFGEGNYSECIVVDTASRNTARGHGKVFVADIDYDGLNELVTGSHLETSIQLYPSVMHSYDITSGGASITKKEIVNCSIAYMSSATTYVKPSITPTFVSKGVFMVAVQKEREYAASLETEIYMLKSVDCPNDIILGANQHGLLRKNTTAAETFSTIAAGIDHDRCYTWWNSTNDRWESYRVGYSYNADKSVPQNDSYFVLMDGTGTTIACSVAAAETVAIPAGYYATYLRESTAKTLSAIKTDMGANVDDLWGFNSTAGAWTDTGTYSVLPNQGLMVNSSAGFNWDGGVP